MTHAFNIVGYIGGSIVDRLLVHPKAISFKITALVRSHEKASKLNTVGIKTHVGSNSDVELLTELASKSDVVFAVVCEPCSDCMHYSSNTYSLIVMI